MNFVIPPKKQVGTLSLEIAEEGEKVLMSDGEFVSFNRPPPKPVMPDWSEIKSIRHYFNRTGFKVYPAWLYHPTEQPRIVKNADEAAELGICYREATVEERGRYGRSNVWDWTEDSKWRPEPWPGTSKFDPTKAEQGKIYVPTPQSQHASNRELLNTVLPEVTAAVVAALKQGGSVAPDKVKSEDWDEFLAFQAWRKTQAAIDVIAPASAEIEEQVEEVQEVEILKNALNTLPPEDERALWEAEAIRKNIKIDRRWSLERLKKTVEQAA